MSNKKNPPGPPPGATITHVAPEERGSVQVLRAEQDFYFICIYYLFVFILFYLIKRIKSVQILRAEQDANDQTPIWEQTSIEGFRVSPYVVTRREAELMVCPRVLFVLAAEQDISPHIVEAVRLELVHSEHHS